MRKLCIKLIAEQFATFYPFAITLIFLGTLLVVKIPEKGAFWGRAMLALVVAVFLAHVNRIFHLYPAHLLFPSGHTTLCFGLAISLGLLRPWTLALTLPAVAFMAYALISLGYHQPIDVAGAIPLVLVIYGVVHRAWPLPSDAFPVRL